MTEKHEITLAGVRQGQGVSISQKVDHKVVLARIATIQHIMATLMKEGTHYGIIPGTKLPSLYKAGSEILLSAFEIAVEPQVEVIREGENIIYRVNCLGRHMATGTVVGIGVGEASTAEDKYNWRSAVCQEEYEETPETHRRKKWFKGKYDQQSGASPAYSVFQVRTNPSDIANTALKMAKKRAQMDMTLTSLAVSDCFTQDIEDLPPEYLDGMTPEEIKAAQQEKNNKYKTKERSGSGQQSSAQQGPQGAATPAQIKLIRGRLGAVNKPESDLCLQFNLKDLTEIDKSKVNEALDWIKGAAN